MAEDGKQLMISVTPSMEFDLGLVKEEWYCQNSQSDMIRDLIIRGLASLESETEEDNKSPK